MIRYTALGDSITAGEDATSPPLAYPRLAVRLLRGRGVQAAGRVLAVPGWTSADLRQSVALNPITPLREATAVSVWVGGNDVARAGLAMAGGASEDIVKHVLAGYAVNLAATVQLIRTVSDARILLCTQYNPFPNTPLSCQAIDSLNDITASVAKRNRATLVPVHRWIDGSQAALLADYRTGRIEDALRGPLPIHPNNRGHEVIAKGMLPYLERTKR